MGEILKKLCLLLPFISKDIKAECKSNLLQKKMTGNKDLGRFLYLLNKAKKLKDKIRKHNFTVPFMVGAGKGVEGFMIMTRRVAALRVTIALCLEHILLLHVVSLYNLLQFLFPVHVL